MKRVLLIALLVALSGCVTNPSKDTPPVMPDINKDTAKAVNVDQRLLEDCPKVQDLGVNVSPSDVLIQHGNDVKVIKCLQDKRDGLIEVVRKAWNIEIQTVK